MWKFRTSSWKKEKEKEKNQILFNPIYIGIYALKIFRRDHLSGKPSTSSQLTPPSCSRRTPLPSTSPLPPAYAFISSSVSANLHSRITFNRSNSVPTSSPTQVSPKLSNFQVSVLMSFAQNIGCLGMFLWLRSDPINTVYPALSHFPWTEGSKYSEEYRASKIENLFSFFLSFFIWFILTEWK